MAYDPAKRHEYYEKTKELVGRTHGSQAKNAKPNKAKLDIVGKGKTGDKQSRAAASDKLLRLTQKAERINVALREAKKLLAEKRQSSQKSRESARKTKKENSDGKSTAAEKAAADKYRAKHKGSNKGGGKSDSPTKPADMSVDQLEDRVSGLQSALSSARSQIKAAAIEVRSLKHSDLEPSALAQPTKEGDSQNGSNP
jgi:hypothetical protein